MSLTRILIAETDEQYLMPFERKFVEEFGDKAEINIITDLEYLKIFFSKPQNIDILVINEKIYNSSFQKHNILNTFLLSEKECEENITADLDINHIYKYTSIKEIYNTIINNVTTRVSDNSKNEKETRVIMVHSPIGGVGKTTTAIGIAGALAKAYKKVLFLGIDNLQGYGYFIEKPALLNNSVERHIKNNSENVYDYLKPNILSETVDYMPLFMSSCSLNLSAVNYMNLINSIVKAKIYDYIIIDTSSEFSESISKLMGIASNVVLVLAQDKYSAYKFNKLSNNIDCSDSNKFVFVCNKYEPEKENYMIKDDLINRFFISEYINLGSEISQLHLKDLADIKSYKKIAYMFL